MRNASADKKAYTRKSEKLCLKEKIVHAKVTAFWDKDQTGKSAKSVHYILLFVGGALYVTKSVY